MPIAAAVACLAVALQTAPAPAEGAILPPVAAPESGVTDAEVDRYVEAAFAVQRIEREAAPEDGSKPQRMAAAVERTGLTPERFNEIAKAQQGDPALQARIQQAAAEKTGGE